MADLEVQDIEGKAISESDIEVLEKFYSFRGKSMDKFALVVRRVCAF